MPKLLFIGVPCCLATAARRSSNPATSHNPTRERRAFTLLEVVISLTILGIMAAVAAPRMHTIIQHQQVDRAAQIMASDIRSAFTSAARGRIPVRISFSTTAPRYVITNRVTGDTIIQRNFSAGEITLAGLTGPPADMEVFPSGVATTGDTVVVGEPAQYARRVSVSRVGFVRVLQ
jgi:prepilin-type N-terminal cleavage/methylation domain-containing protein